MEKKNMLVLADVPGAVASMAAFQKLKEGILNKETDMLTISNRTYIKRSGWRKIALGFNITTEIVSIEREQFATPTNPKGEWIVHVKARALAPNGRFSEEIGSCQASEVLKQKMEPTVHNIETKAATRAINRAISNLVGGGEVSAEELIETGETASAKPNSSPGPASAAGASHTSESAGGETAAQATPQENAHSSIGWKVRGEPYPLPMEGPDGKLYGFLKKTLDKLPAGTVKEVAEEGRLLGLEISKELAPDKSKELNQVLMWTLQKSSNATKEEIVTEVSTPA